GTASSSSRPRAARRGEPARHAAGPGRRGSPMSEAPAKTRHRIRENIDALAIAVLMAVLMKYFAIEAYQIPTSSMQPTMMGSKVAGIYDRILVDKSRYLLTEPKRFDIAVFHYPIRKT